MIVKLNKLIKNSNQHSWSYFEAENIEVTDVKLSELKCQGESVGEDFSNVTYATATSDILSEFLFDEWKRILNSVPYEHREYDTQEKATKAYHHHLEEVFKNYYSCGWYKLVGEVTANIDLQTEGKQDDAISSIVLIVGKSRGEIKFMHVAFNTFGFILDEKGRTIEKI